MWGIIPAAGVGSRIQPLAFSKELLPVGSRFDGKAEHPRAVSEYLVERMLASGVDKICFVISPGKSDILDYFGARIGKASFSYVVQQQPKGLCDSIFTPLPLISEDEEVVIGLPDTVWFPLDGLAVLPNGKFSFLLFPVERPEYFDAVITDESSRVLQVQVKQIGAQSNWIWGAMKMPAKVLRGLKNLWDERLREDEYLGTLVNAFIERGNEVYGYRIGTTYVDVGTLHGYREAIKALERSDDQGVQKFESRIAPII